MNEQRTARPAGAGARRRSPLFTRQPEPEPTVLSPAEEEIANALTNVVDERVEEGLQALEAAGHDPDARGGHRALALVGQGRPSRAGAHRQPPLEGSGDPEPDRLERRALPGAVHPRGPRRGRARRPGRDRPRHPGGDGVLRRVDPRDRRLPHAPRRRGRPEPAGAGRAPHRRDVQEPRRARPHAHRHDPAAGPRARRDGRARDLSCRRGDAGIRAGRRRGRRAPRPAGRGARRVLREPGRRPDGERRRDGPRGGPGDRTAARADVRGHGHPHAGTRSP